MCRAIFPGAQSLAIFLSSQQNFEERRVTLGQLAQRPSSDYVFFLFIPYPAEIVVRRLFL